MAPSPHPSLDAVSRAILRQLQEDGRRPYAAIGKAVGLSEAAVRQRIQRLVAAGVVRIVGVTDAASLGLHRRALIGIKAEGDLEALADALTAVERVDSVVVTAGAFDVLVEVVCTDDEELLTVLNDDIRPLPGVRATETFVHLRRRARTAGPPA